VRRRAAPVDPSTLPEDLGVDWSRWSDGRAYRLKRKRDFPNVSPGLARTACEQAAMRMGKVARTVRDKTMPDKLIWVQFADAEVGNGQPCPRCGSRRLINLHADVVRCPECKAQLLLSNKGLEAMDEAAEEASGSTTGPAKRARLAQRLHSLESIHLQRSGEAAHNDLYSGWGELDGTRFIVLAEFEPSDDGEETSVENMDERVVEVKVLPSHFFEGLIDVDELAVRPEADWDLIF
jgi:DNA-directed RNA polymerase subunit RPC12/RpoP